MSLNLQGETPPSLNLKMATQADDLVSIIIVHNDKPGHLSICLQSISVCSNNNNTEIIVVDNGSKTDDAKDLLSSIELQEDCKVIRNKENVGWTKAANQGGKAANPNSKYFIFLHHDVVILNPSWIDLLVSVSESQNSGLVGLSMSSYSMADVGNKKTKIDFIEEWCMLTTRECWQDCGGFEEKLEQVGAPFLYTLAAQMNDYNPQCLKNQIVHHYNVFAMSINDLEQANEKAMMMIPTLMRQIQEKFRKES